jgi:hypothetical protein
MISNMIYGDYRKRRAGVEAGCAGNEVKETGWATPLRLHRRLRRRPESDWRPHRRICRRWMLDPDFPWLRCNALSNNKKITENKVKWKMLAAV